MVWDDEHPPGARGALDTEPVGEFVKFVRPSGEGYETDLAGFRLWLEERETAAPGTAEATYARIRAFLFGLLGGGAAVARLRTLAPLEVEGDGDNDDLLGAVAFARLLPEPGELEGIWQRAEAEMARPEVWARVEVLAERLERDGVADGEAP